MPVYYNLIDTTYDITDLIKIRAVAASIDSGRIVFTKGFIDRNATYIKDEKALFDFYDGVKEGLVNTSQAELLTDSVVELSNLKVQKLSLSLNYHGEPAILHYIGFLLNQHKYSFQIVELNSKKNRYGSNISDLLIFSGNLSFRKQLIQ